MDEDRVAATIAADRSRLESIYSNDLCYAHSNGVADTKAEMINAIVFGRLKYVQIEYVDREFVFPTPGIALMRGISRVKAVAPSGNVDVSLRFLAVWRLENGKWRFLAWQSCSMPNKAESMKHPMKLNRTKRKR